VKGLFEIRSVSVRFGAAEALRGASLELHAGEFVAIAGPNGAGKSTLLSVIAGLLAPSSGACLFLGQEAHRWNRREFARRAAVMTQAEPTDFPFTAAEVVYMGRMPHATGIYETPADHAAVAKALAETGAEAFRDRDFRTLSGGEKQRVLISSALAQETAVLLLDEPSNHLDLQHQISLYRLLRDLSRNGMLVVAVTHDLNLAAAYAGRLVLLDEGRIRADGAPGDVLGSELVGEIFHVPVELYRRRSGQPWLAYGE
jgi:iron complex transport system ATP-binding protein